MEGVSSAAGAGSGTDGCAPMEGLRLGALGIQMRWVCCPMSRPADKVGGIARSLRSLDGFVELDDDDSTELDGYPMMKELTET